MEEFKTCAFSLLVDMPVELADNYDNNNLSYVFRLTDRIMITSIV